MQACSIKPMSVAYDLSERTTSSTPIIKTVAILVCFIPATDFSSLMHNRYCTKVYKNIFNLRRQVKILQSVVISERWRRCPSDVCRWSVMYIDSNIDLIPWRLFLSNDSLKTLFYLSSIKKVYTRVIFFQSKTPTKRILAWLIQIG